MLEGTLGTLKIRLATTVPRNERYRRHYIEVAPQSEQISSAEAGLVVDTKFRPWVVRDWSRGEGFDVWSREQQGYRVSDGVRPHPFQAGLILARRGTNSQRGGADLADGGAFGPGNMTVWTCKDDTAYPWSHASDNWSAGVATGAGASRCLSIAQGAALTHMFSSHATGAIWRWAIDGSTQVEHFDTTTDPFTDQPVLVAFRDLLYALDGADLYLINQSVVDTRTLVVQTGEILAPFGAGSPSIGIQAPRWLCVSDVGPAWLTVDRAGNINVWEYNVASDTEATIGRVPTSFGTPFAIHFAKGFYFVLYKTASVIDTTTGDFFVYAFRGQQTVTLGPFRSNDESEPATIVGVFGSELLIAQDNDVWAYDLDAGGVFHWGIDSDVTSDFIDAIVIGDSVVCDQDSGDAVTLFKSQYVASGTIHLGWHDWDYPGLLKNFHDLTIITDPLPASTSVTAAVAVDGSTTYLALTGTHDTDGATRFTFTVADPTTTPITGNRFEVRLTLTTTASGNTPTVIEVSARATGVDSVLEILMSVDAGTYGEQTSSVLIDGLNTLKTGKVPVTWTDPFQQREDSEAADSFVVMVSELVTPTTEDASEDEDNPVAQVKLRVMSLV